MFQGYCQAEIQATEGFCILGIMYSNQSGEIGISAIIANNNKYMEMSIVKLFNRLIQFKINFTPTELIDHMTTMFFNVAQFMDSSEINFENNQINVATRTQLFELFFRIPLIYAAFIQLSNGLTEWEDYIVRAKSFVLIRLLRERIQMYIVKKTNVLGHIIDYIEPLNTLIQRIMLIWEGLQLDLDTPTFKTIGMETFRSILDNYYDRKQNQWQLSLVGNQMYSVVLDSQIQHPLRLAKRNSGQSIVTSYASPIDIFVGFAEPDVARDLIERMRYLKAEDMNFRSSQSQQQMKLAMSVMNKAVADVQKYRQNVKSVIQGFNVKFNSFIQLSKLSSQNSIRETQEKFNLKHTKMEDKLNEMRGKYQADRDTTTADIKQELKNMISQGKVLVDRQIEDKIQDIAKQLSKKFKDFSQFAKTKVDLMIKSTGITIMTSLNEKTRQIQRQMELSQISSRKQQRQYRNQVQNTLKDFRNEIVKGLAYGNERDESVIAKIDSLKTQNSRFSQQMKTELQMFRGHFEESVNVVNEWKAQFRKQYQLQLQDYYQQISEAKGKLIEINAVQIKKILVQNSNNQSKMRQLQEYFDRSLQISIRQFGSRLDKTVQRLGKVSDLRQSLNRKIINDGLKFMVQKIKNISHRQNTFIKQMKQFSRLTAIQMKGLFTNLSGKVSNNRRIIDEFMESMETQFKQLQQGFAILISKNNEIIEADKRTNRRMNELVLQSIKIEAQLQDFKSNLRNKQGVIVNKFSTLQIQMQNDFNIWKNEINFLNGRISQQVTQIRSKMKRAFRKAQRLIRDLNIQQKKNITIVLNKVRQTNRQVGQIYGAANQFKDDIKGKLNILRDQTQSSLDSIMASTYTKFGQHTLTQKYKSDGQLRYAILTNQNYYSKYLEAKKQGIQQLKYLLQN